MSKVSSRKKVSWATLLNLSEDQTATEFQKWSFAQRYIGKNTKYALLKKLIELGIKVFYNEHLGEFIKLLNSKGYIKQGDFIEGINLMLLYAMNKMPEEL